MAIGSPAAVTVPLLDLSAQNGPLRDEILAAITRVVDSQRFIMGPEIEGLERELARQLDAAHAIAVSSGTDALLLAMMALGIGPGDEVITPTYSFFATAGCVSRLGATPVFVDIDPSTYNARPDGIAAAMTPRTKAILPVHLFGLAADMAAILDVARPRGIPVIEDAAQAIGSRIGADQVGTMGAIGCFSFFPSKNLGAFGDAGLLTTNDSSLADAMRLLRNHGAAERYYHARIGGNFRMDALQAAILRVKAPHLPAWTDARRRNADRYRHLVNRHGLGDIVVLPAEPRGFHHIYNQFVIRVPRRDGLKTCLAEHRVSTEIYYPVPFHRQECFAALESPADAFPVADDLSATSLALPIYGELTDVQQAHVVATIADFYDRAR